MLANNSTPSSLQELVKSISIQVSGSSGFRRFQRTYRDDRVAFAYDCFPTYRKTITPYQTEILSYYDEGKTRVAVRGPHGLGKTFLASVIVHHTVLTAEGDCKVPTTASAWRQLEKYLWPEIIKQSKQIDWSIVGRPPYNPKHELLIQSIRLSDGIVEAFALASDDYQTLEGAHATTLFYVFDEAKAIPRETWNAAEGAFSTEGLEVVKVKPDDFKLLEEQPGLVIYSTDEPPIAKVIDVKVEEKVDNLVGSSEDQKAQKLEKVVEIGPPMRPTLTPATTIPGADPLVQQAPPSQGQPIAAQIGTRNPNSTTGANSSDPLLHVPKNPLDQASLDNPTQSSMGTEPPSKAAIYATTKTNDLEASGVIPELRSTRSTDGVTRTIIDTSYSTLAHAYALAISTPGEPSGQFYDIHTRKPGYEDWTVRHVTVEEAIEARRISSKWVDQRRKQWGQDSSIFMNRVLGEFAETSEEGVIPLSWIRAAADRWLAWRKGGAPEVVGKRTLGCDIARGGEDKTVLVERDGILIRNMHVFSKLATTSTAGHIHRLHGGRFIHIEMDGGLGASVYDMLREDRVGNLRPITVSAPTAWKDASGELSFANVRAAMWWNMRQLLDPDTGVGIMLPPVNELQIDLSSPRWEMKRGATVQLESKENIHSRIGRSTDYGDAVCLAFWEASAGGGVVI